MTTPVVFIAAVDYQFVSAVRAEKFAREAGAEVLNPIVSLPCHLAQCCYLPIELAMVEASDILWCLGSTVNSNVRCCVDYAIAQKIPIVLNEQELTRELAKYTGNKQMVMEDLNAE